MEKARSRSGCGSSKRRVERRPRVDSLDNPAVPEWLRQQLKDEHLYAVLEESLELIKDLVRKMRQLGFTQYYGGIRRPSSVIHMCFYRENGEDFEATISFKKDYQRKTGKKLTFEGTYALRDAIMNLVLN